MKQSDIYRQNAENCMQMAEGAEGEPAYNRLREWKLPGSLWPRNRIGLTASNHPSVRMMG
jgi:hypothetical protein